MSDDVLNAVRAVFPGARVTVRHTPESHERRWARLTQGHTHRKQHAEAVAAAARLEPLQAKP